MIQRYLTIESMRILDIGGGPGVHAEWLAQAGHDVQLIDPVPRQIEQARELAASLERTFTADIGDARNLDQPDGIRTEPAGPEFAHASGRRKTWQLKAVHPGG